MICRTFCWLVVLALGACAVVALRIVVAPLDLSDAPFVPSFVNELTNRDEFAYPAHATLATLLEQVRADPVAVGVQWLKAASHARDAVEAERADAGLRTAMQRSGNPAAFEASLCSYLRPTESFQRANLQCLPTRR